MNPQGPAPRLRLRPDASYPPGGLFASPLKSTPNGADEGDVKILLTAFVYVCLIVALAVVSACTNRPRTDDGCED